MCVHTYECTEHTYVLDEKVGLIHTSSAGFNGAALQTETMFVHFLLVGKSKVVKVRKKIVPIE